MRILTEIGCRAYLHRTGVGKASTGMPSTTGRSIRTIDVLLADLDRGLVIVGAVTADAEGSRDRTVFVAHDYAPQAQGSVGHREQRLPHR